MKRMASIRVASAVIAATLALGTAAHAAALRTFVASFGDDANTATNCARTAPCRTLAQAFTVTSASGHIFIVDAGGYGALTITRAVTIVGTDGALIGVPSAGIGITINAGANDTVSIRGLIIDGAGVGIHGIFFSTGKSLVVTDSTIRNLTSSGIFLVTNNTSSALAVSNTVLANSDKGILVSPSGFGAVTASLSRLQLYNMVTHGILLQGASSTGSIRAVVSDSVAANNSAGLAVISTSAPSSLLVTRSVSANNATGLISSGVQAFLRVGQSTLTGNTTSWLIAGNGQLRSYGDNNIDGNDDGDPAPTAIGKK